MKPLNEQRIFGFDLFRAVGILLVVGYHALQLFEPFDHRIWRFGVFSVYSVEGFYVLSGFLIGTILIGHLMEQPEFIFATVRRFYARRWLRTFPAYYGALLFVLLFFLPGHESGDRAAAAKSFFFLQDFSGTASPFFPESWSLCIEEWFYFSFPLLLFAGIKLFSSRNCRPVIFLATALLFILALNLVRTIYVTDSHPDFESQLRKITLLRIDAPLYGVLAAFAWRYRKETLLSRKNGLAIAGLVLMIVVMMMQKNYLGQTVKGIFIFPLTGISFCLFLPWLYALKQPAPLLQKLVNYFSSRSYTLYLVHLSIVLFGIVQPNLRPVTLEGTLLVSLLYFLLSIGFSEMIHRIFERPFLVWRDRKFPAA